jgi:molybdopterin converting factor small subunit
MTIRVLLFGPEAAAAGRDRVEVEAPADPTCHELRERIGAACPALRPLLPAARFAINAEFAAMDAVVRPGDEVALIGLVSGG